MTICGEEKGLRLMTSDAVADKCDMMMKFNKRTRTWTCPACGYAYTIAPEQQSLNEYTRKS